jgi:hypothetical protein
MSRVSEVPRELDTERDGGSMGGLHDDSLGEWYPSFLPSG